MESKKRIPWNKGKKMSKKHKENISNSLIGNKRALGNKSKLGQIFSKKTKKKMSECKKLDKHWNWKGGKSFEKYPEEFFKIRNKIRKRDNYICQECGLKRKEIKKQLDVHHIDFNKNNNHLKNLITLCRSCHGKTQFGEKDWINYYKNKMGGMR